MPDPTVKKFDTNFLMPVSSDQKATFLETGNASAYLRNSAERRLGRLDRALEYLRGRMTSGEIRDICARLAGAEFDPLRPGPDIASVLDSENVRVQEIAAQAQEEPAYAQALRAVAQELDGPSDHLSV